MTSRENLSVLGKIQKITQLFYSNRNKVTKIDKDGNESVVTISYKTKFIDSARFMATLLPNLVNNLVEEFQKIKCKRLWLFS